MTGAESDNKHLESTSIAGAVDAGRGDGEAVCGKDAAETETETLRHESTRSASSTSRTASQIGAAPILALLSDFDAATNQSECGVYLFVFYTFLNAIIPPCKYQMLIGYAKLATGSLIKLASGVQC